jgi:hypothetical protein
MATYIIEDGVKLFQLDDGSKVPVMAPLSLDQGSSVKLIPSQEAYLSGIEAGLDSLNAVQAGDVQTLLNAPDLVQTYTWLDAGTVNQRINTITHASSLFGKTMTETYTYSGSPGAYVLSTITRS